MVHGGFDVSSEQLDAFDHDKKSAKTQFKKGGVERGSIHERNADGALFCIVREGKFQILC